MRIDVTGLAVDADAGGGVTVSGEMPLVLEQGRAVGRIDERDLSAGEGDIGWHEAGKLLSE